MSQNHSREDQKQYRSRAIPLPHLRELRRRRGLSQKELGEVAGVASGTVYRLENGLRGAAGKELEAGRQQATPSVTWPKRRSSHKG